MSDAGSLRSRTVRLHGAVDLLEALPTPAGIAWVRGGTGFVAWGGAARLDAGSGPGRFRAAAEAASSLLGSIERDAPAEGPGPLVVGSFTFLRDAPGSWLVLPAVVLRWTGEAAWLTVTAPGDTITTLDARDAQSLLRAVSDPHRFVPAGSGPAIGSNGSSSPTAPGREAGLPTQDGGATPSTPDSEHLGLFGAPTHRPKSDDEWMAAVASARQSIREGRLLKVVLARDVPVEQEAPFDPRAVARRLADRYPECWTFVCGGLVGASPELLVRREGSNVHSLTLAGSARRGEDAAADQEAGQALLASRKDRWEHELAVRFVRETLARCCSELWVDPEPTLLRLANVQHLATSSYGLLDEPLSALELAGRLHPGAAICGTPTAEALELIRQLEGMDRGRYAAPVGWMDADGDGEWAIALRCAEVSGGTPGRARLFAGAGIVAESDPESELEETRLKLRPMLSALEASQGTRP